MRELAIAGAGMTGAYLYHILKDAGLEADLFDHQQVNRCGITSCAWGTSPGFIDLVARAGLDAEKYVLRHLDYVLIDDVRVKAELMVFDKPKLIKDLLKDAEVHFEPLPVATYERVIDATGVSRALLPPIEDDIVMMCRQYIVETKQPLENQIKLGGIGYAWCFPLSCDRYHVGCGSLLSDPQEILKSLGWIQGKPGRYEKKVLCGCTGKIRLTGPHKSLPFVTRGTHDGIWGIGEAIGCVAPLAGDGIVPGMRTVQLLLNKWDKPMEFTDAVLDEFHWMEDERRVIDKLRNAEGVGITDARVLRKNSKRMGMQVRLRDAFSLLKNLR